MDEATFSAVQAARDAAYWAGWTGTAAWVIGLSSLLLTGGGLVFVWRQLRVAEESARAATAAAHAALLTSRPWLAIRDTGNSVIFGEGAFRQINIGFKLENSGQAPALNVGYGLAAFHNHDEPEDLLKCAAERDRMIPFEMGALLPSDASERFVGINIEAGLPARIVIYAGYDIPGDDDRRYTAQIYDLTIMDMPVTLQGLGDGHRLRVRRVSNRRMVMT